MAADTEEDAADSRLCQQAGGTDLGDAVGKPYFSGKDYLEYDSGCGRDIRGNLPGGDF